MQRRLYIKDALHELNYKDRRSLIRWCRNNGVTLKRDAGSKMLYVIKEQFYAAKLRTENFVLPQEKKETFEAPGSYRPKSKYEEECLSRLLLRNKYVS